MAQDTPYHEIVVESFIPRDPSGRHGLVHIRPLPGQGFSTHLFIQCSKRLSEDYPVGTKFKIRAKLTDREGGTEFLYSSYKWPFDVVSAKQAAAFIRQARVHKRDG